MLESPQTEKKRTIKAISTLNQSGSYLATRDPDNKGIRMSANSTQLQKIEVSRRKTTE